MAGIAHADNQYRDSFAYDVMDAIRPFVDEWLLDFIKIHGFYKREFFENRDGGIRLTLNLTPFLAETISIWSDKIKLVIEIIRAILLED